MKRVFLLFGDVLHYCRASVGFHQRVCCRKLYTYEYIKIISVEEMGFGEQDYVQFIGVDEREKLLVI